MKLQKLIPVGILLLLSVAALSAQTGLPNPHDDACWSSLAALRACELQAYDQAMDQAQRCSSYPEYQCLPAAERSEREIAEKHSHKAVSTAAAGNASSAAVSAVASSELDGQAK